MEIFKRAMEKSIEKVTLSIEKIGIDLKEYPAQPDGQYFKEEAQNSIPFAHIFCWTPSFFTGMAYWAYEATKDEKFIKWMNGFYSVYEDKVFATPMETMHDLGFLYSPYAVALYKLNNDQNMKKIGLKAADELAKRFIPNGGYIKAWGKMDGCVPSYVDKELAKDHFFTESKGLAIIDCMMNLPLLFWASETTGHPYYKQIAISHADITKKYFIREDGSIYHAYRFDEETGEPIGGANYCGYGVDSHWARGTAWAIYGFTIAHRYTGRQDYLETVLTLTKEFIRLCKGDIPIWDFRLPKETPAIYCGKERDHYNWDITKKSNEKYVIDTSAAAIVVCGIYELIEIIQDKELEKKADQLLLKLTKEYFNEDKQVPGILRGQNGQQMYGCYGDYFYMEALMKKVYKSKSIW